MSRKWLKKKNVVENIKWTGETLSDALTIIKHPDFLHPFSKSGHNEWDDGSEHDGVIKIHVGASRKGIKYVKFDYVKNGQTKEAPLHGVNSGRSLEVYTFVINHPEEYLASVEAWYSNLGLIHGLKFKSNKKASALFGQDEGDLFTLQVHDKKIVGFHGFAGDKLHSLDAYFSPLTISTPLTTIKRLEAKGGERDLWDDGVHENVRKVSLGKGRDGVAFLKIEYVDGYQVVVGDAHGKDTMLGTEEFEVDEDDYIVYVEGYREKVSDSTSEIISFLRFKTYKGKASQTIEKETPAKFVLQGGKIVGFHGRSTDVLHSLGAYISFSATPKLSGHWIKMEQEREGPALRCSHAIAQVGNKIYSFGGEFTPNYPIDKHLYVFDIETRSWSVAQATGDVPQLSCLGVGMVSIGSTLYVFGGRDASRKYNGFYSFDTTKNEWKLLTPVEEGPTPRSFHSMAADEENVYVFGGVSVTKRLKTLHSYNIYDHKWVQCSTPGESFSIRGGAGLEVVRGKVWVVYGFNGTELDDVHYYVPLQDKWTQVNTFGERPSKRSVFASAVVGKHIVMFGGEIQMDPLAHKGPGQLADGIFTLDTETLKWERLDKVGAEAESPSIRGWSASTSGTIDGKKGLVMLGGKAPNNDRFSDLFFYEMDSI